jgi:hypothetical protein
MGDSPLWAVLLTKNRYSASGSSSEKQPSPSVGSSLTINLTARGAPVKGPMAPGILPGGWIPPAFQAGFFMVPSLGPPAVPARRRGF